MFLQYLLRPRFHAFLLKMTIFVASGSRASVCFACPLASSASAMPKFSVSSCAPPSRGAKRPTDEAAASAEVKPKRVPRASDLVVVEQAPRPQKQQARMPTSAPVVICVYLVSESAADVWPSMYENSAGLSVWQIQLEHAARPNVLFDQVSSWNDFLKRAQADDSTVPSSLRELQEKCGSKLVISDSSDPDSAGFVQWRSAWYVAGEDVSAVENMLALVNSWLGYKREQAAKEHPYEVRLHPHIGVQLNADDFEHWSTEPEAARLPLAYFEAQPPQGKRVVTLNLEADGDNLSILISGNTWAYRSRLDALQVPGGYHEGASGEKDKTYYRVMKNLHANADREKIFGLLQNCFKNLALRVVVDSEPESGSAAAALIQELQEMPQLHVVKA